MMFSPSVNKAVFTHRNKVSVIAEKKVYLIKFLGNTWFRKSIVQITVVSDKESASKEHSPLLRENLRKCLCMLPFKLDFPNGEPTYTYLNVTIF